MSEERHGPRDRQGEEPVGDLGEEAARLLGVLAGWTRSVDEHVATGSPECQWCPVCRVVHVVRSSSPEVRDHLVTAATSLLQAASGLLAAAGADRDTHGGPPADPGVEHIDLDGDPAEGSRPEQHEHSDEEDRP